MTRHGSFARVGPARRRLLLALLAGVLALAGLSIAPATAHPSLAIYATSAGRAVDAGGSRGDVVWILAVGSDARPGESITRSRGDAIQLVGVNTVTGAGVVLGIPRDSYVPIPGHGSNKINASMAFGGPELFARTVGDMVGVQPDYVFVIDFQKFTQTVDHLGGLHIDVPVAVDSPTVRLPGGRQTLSGAQALGYARARHGVPGGDFGRSRHQGHELTAMLRQLQKADGATLGATALDLLRGGVATTIGPAEAFRLYQAGMAADPGSFKHCVLVGGFGWAGSASIVVVNRSEVARIMDDVKGDATLSGSCPPGQP